MRQLAIVALLAFGLANAEAEEFTFLFDGTLDSVPVELSSDLSVGMPFSGSYTFDSNAVDLNDHATVGEYAIDDFFLSLNGQTFTQQQGTIIISDNTLPTDAAPQPGDYYGALVGFLKSDSTLNGYNLDIAFVDLWTPGLDTTAITDVGLTTSPPNIEDFSSAGVTLGFGDRMEIVSVSGTLNSLQVPEPSAAALIMTIALFGVRRFVRSSSLCSEFVACGSL